MTSSGCSYFVDGILLNLHIRSILLIVEAPATIIMLVAHLIRAGGARIIIIGVGVVIVGAHVIIDVPVLVV